jgi:hypothetical protein
LKILKPIYNDVLTYNKNVYPIVGYDVYNSTDISNVIQSLEKRRKIIDEIKKLPSVATRNLKDDIRKGLSGLDGIGDDAGNSVGNSFSKGFARGFGNNAGELLDVGRIFKEADKAREKFADLQRASFALGAGLTALGGVIGALVGGIGILIATVIAASPTLLGLVGIFAAVAVAATATAPTATTTNPSPTPMRCIGIGASHRCALPTAMWPQRLQFLPSSMWLASLPTCH